jgi:hypothetical protein
MLKWNAKLTLILLVTLLVTLAGILANFNWATNFNW